MFCNSCSFITEHLIQFYSTRSVQSAMKLKLLLGNRCENWNSSDEARAKSTVDSHNEKPNQEEGCFLKSLDSTNRTENENQDLNYPNRFTPAVSEPIDLSCKFSHRSVDSWRQDDEINACTTKGSGKELRRIDQIIDTGKYNREQEWEKEVPETINGWNDTHNTIQNYSKNQLLACILRELILQKKSEERLFAIINRLVGDKSNEIMLTAEVDLCANVNRPETNTEIINHELLNEVNLADSTMMGADHAPEENMILASCSQKDVTEPSNSGNSLLDPVLEETSSQKEGRPESIKASMELGQNKTSILQVERDLIVTRKEQPSNKKPNEFVAVPVRKSERLLCKALSGRIKSNTSNGKSSRKSKRLLFKALSGRIKSNTSNDKFSKKKYTCCICGDAQTTIKKMYNHKRNHFLYTCIVCKKKICRIDGFQRHLKNSHPDFSDQAS